MPVSVGVLVYSGYQELEFWYPVLRLREAEIAVSVLGVEGEQAAYSLLGYPVVPNAPLAKVSPADFSAIVIPGGKVDNILKDAALKSFLAAASNKGAVLAGISQAAALINGATGKTLIADTSDELPQWTRALLAELKSKA